MIEKESNKQEPNVSWKVKFAITIIWTQLLFLTWLVLIYNSSVKLQVISFITTVIAIYLHIVLLQDYFYLKLHKGLSKFRRDIRIIEPLIPKRTKKNDNKA